MADVESTLLSKISCVAVTLDILYYPTLGTLLCTVSSLLQIHFVSRSTVHKFLVPECLDLCIAFMCTSVGLNLLNNVS